MQGPVPSAGLGINLPELVAVRYRYPAGQSSITLNSTM